jgi:hypothetical protein
MTKILFVAPNRDQNRATYNLLCEKAPDETVVWCEGVFNDLYKFLPKNKIYYRQIEPKPKGGHNVVSYGANEFDIALIDMSPEEKWEGVLAYPGAISPDELTEVLTWTSTVCLGTSREEKYLSDLTGKGAILACVHEKLATDLPVMLIEATRIIRISRQSWVPGLPALTLRQPWAMSVFTCGKDMENRNWMTMLKGTIAVHVAEEQPEGSFEAGVAFIKEVLKKQGKRIKVPEYDRSMRGKIIGLVDIGNLTLESDSPWFEGTIGWELSNARLLPKPVRVTSAKRRFWMLDGAEVAAIEKQLPPAPTPTGIKAANKKSSKPSAATKPRGKSRRTSTTKRRATAIL